jgi:hypothetical protein
MLLQSESYAKQLGGPSPQHDALLVLRVSNELFIGHEKMVGGEW